MNRGLAEGSPDVDDERSRPANTLRDGVRKKSVRSRLAARGSEIRTSVPLWLGAVTRSKNLAHYLLGHNMGRNLSSEVRRVVYFRLKSGAHLGRWRDYVRDELLEFAPVRAAVAEQSRPREGSGPVGVGGFEEGEFEGDSPTEEVTAQTRLRGADAVQLRTQEIDEAA